MPDDILFPPEPATEAPVVDTSAEPAAPEPSIEEKALSAFGEGVDAVTPDPAKAPEPEKAPEPAKEPEKPAEPEKPVEPTKEEVEAALAAEAKSLGLREGSKATARFHELSLESKELKALKPQFEELKTLAAAAEKRSIEWEDTVTSTGANPEQFGKVLGYLKLINSGDPTLMLQGYETLADELAYVGKMLGKEAPGIDPLDGHQDLQQRVQNGELDRRDALEITQLRQAQAIRNAQSQQQTQVSGKQQAIDAAVKNVETLSTQLKAADPHFDARWPILAPQVKLICEAFPPEQWAQRIATAHAGLPPYVPPTPIRHAATPVMRPGGAASMDRKPANDLEAFDMGLQRMQG